MYLMSAPAANALSPAPVSTITRTASSLRSSVSLSRSLPRVSTSSAFIASGRSMVTTATASPSRCTFTAKASLASLNRNLRFQEVDDLGRRGAGREDLRDALAPELGGVLVRNRAADDDEHVFGAVLLQDRQDLRDEGHVRPGEDRDHDRVGILLHRGHDDLFRRLVEAGVDNLHPRVSERPRDDLRSPVVAVETRFGDDNAYFSGHSGECSREDPARSERLLMENPSCQ